MGCYAYTVLQGIFLSFFSFTTVVKFFLRVKWPVLLHIGPVHIGSCVYPRMWHLCDLGC